jgi:hypothetical protein
LIEAIESGLVKIPFLPESDNTQELPMPVLRNLYEHVKEELPRKGQRKQKSEAAKEGQKTKEQPPRLPFKVKAALDQFYGHYFEYYHGVRKNQEQKTNLFSSPPVFILVCNNTSVSKEVYKYIAGYEYLDEAEQLVTVSGAKELFSNYDPVTKKPRKKPPTLLIDSDALDNSDQINEDFKKIFKIHIQSVLEKRDQEVIFWLIKELIKYHFSDDEGSPDFQKFNKVKLIVTEWYNKKVVLLNIQDQRYKRLLYFDDPKKMVCGKSLDSGCKFFKRQI